MSIHQRQLKRQLAQAGAKSREIDELSSVASRLRLLKSADTKSNRLTTLMKPVALAAAVLALGFIIEVFAQSAAPTSWLYPVQKLSDAVAVGIHPSYQADVMMRRAQQVNQLVASHADSSVILATLSSYQSEAAGYKTMPHANYAAFEYCKTNLEQAAAKAPVNIRAAILNSLNSLSEV